MHDLALQVVERDAIVVDDAEGADAGRGQVHQHGRAEPAGADHQHPGGLELLLALAAHLAQHEMPLVALDFLCCQGHAGSVCRLLYERQSTAHMRSARLLFTPRQRGFRRQRGDGDVT